MSALDLPQPIGTVEADETAVGGYQPGRRGFAGANKTTVLADDPSPGPATQRPCRALRPSRRSGSAGRSGRLPRGTAAPTGQNVSGPLDAGSPAKPTSGQPLRTTPFRPFFGLSSAESGRSSVRNGVWSGRRDSNPRHSAWEARTRGPLPKPDPDDASTLPYPGSGSQGGISKDRSACLRSPRSQPACAVARAPDRGASALQLHRPLIEQDPSVPTFCLIWYLPWGGPELAIATGRESSLKVARCQGCQASAG